MVSHMHMLNLEYLFLLMDRYSLLPFGVLFIVICLRTNKVQVWGCLIYNNLYIFLTSNSSPFIENSVQYYWFWYLFELFVILQVRAVAPRKSDAFSAFFEENQANCQIVHGRAPPSAPLCPDTPSRHRRCQASTNSLSRRCTIVHYQVHHRARWFQVNTVGV